MHKISREDLLKLKDSKPVPITAHSHEVIVPVVYASRVNKFLEKEGVHLPLTHHQLAELKRKASKVKGTLKKEDEDDEGSSHAKGTHNIKVSNIKGNVIINTETKKKKKRKAKKAKPVIKTFSGLLQAEDKGTGIRIRPPPSNTLRPNYNTFATIRPQGITYSANTPTLHDLQLEFKAEAKKEREAIEKREKQLLEEGEKQRKNIDNLQLALDREKEKQRALIVNDSRLKSIDSFSNVEFDEVSISSSDEDEKYESRFKKDALLDVKKVPRYTPLETYKRDIKRLMGTYGLRSDENEKLIDRQTSNQEVFTHYMDLVSQMK